MGVSEGENDPALEPPEGAIDLDGSLLEGGGQILRIAAALSAITSVPIRVRNIRANRSKPGLRPQHLAGLELLSRICQGKLQGASCGSSVITLEPDGLLAGDQKADPGTAGSCCLLAQAAVPPLLFANSSRSHPVSQLDLRGGTDADLAPPVDYFLRVLVPTLSRLWGLNIDAKLHCRGFFPKGCGKLQIGVHSLPAGQKLKPIRLIERGPIVKVTIHAFSAGKLQASVCECMAAAASVSLEKELGGNVPVTTSLQHYSHTTTPSAHGEGAGILIIAESSTKCILASAVPGKRGISSEDVGARAACELLEDLAHKGCVDRWMEDQLIIFMALAAGEEESVITCGNPTLHTRTAMLIAEKMTGAQFRVEAPGDGKQFYTIRCRGSRH